jgi:hypothetical protein
VVFVHTVVVFNRVCCLLEHRAIFYFSASQHKREILHPNSVKTARNPSLGWYPVMKLRMLFGMAVVVASLAPCISAGASLGGDLASVQDDQAKMQGPLRTTSNNSYNVHEIQATSGIVVREYVSLSGSVFGVAWQGRTHPDLRQVLGAYYDTYVQAVQAQRAQRHGHGPLLIQQSGLVVQMGGHMRQLTGRAYLPQSLPAGIRLEEIR